MIRNVILLLLVGASITRADPSADALTAAGIAEFSAAYQVWNCERFGKAANLFHQAEVKSPASAINRYWRGVALFHRMLQLKSTSNHTAAHATMDEAINSLESAVKFDAGHAESHALLGTLYGMKIDGGMVRAIRYGPTVQKHQQAALKYGPSNPRVHYLLGTGQFHTAKDEPARRVALKTLQAAEKLFLAEAKHPAKDFEPRWGYSSCLTFIARTYESLGHKKQSAEYYQKALAIHPIDHAAKEGLARIATQNRIHHE